MLQTKKCECVKFKRHEDESSDECRDKCRKQKI